MIEAGDVHLADVGTDTRRHVVVLTSAKFHRLTGRAIVAPLAPTVALDADDPFVVDAESETVHVAFLRSTPLERLLDRTDRLSNAALRNVHRAALEALR